MKRSPMSDPETDNPLAGISECEQEIMLRLLRTPRQPQKDAPKPMSVRGSLRGDGARKSASGRSE